jgi:hypothetical protein
MAIYPPELSDGNDIILFSKPAGEKGERMTVRAALMVVRHGRFPD